MGCLLFRIFHAVFCCNRRIIDKIGAVVFPSNEI